MVFCFNNDVDDVINELFTFWIFQYISTKVCFVFDVCIYLFLFMFTIYLVFQQIMVFCVGILTLMNENMGDSINSVNR